MGEAKILYAIIVHDSNARRGRGHRSEQAAWRKGSLLWGSLDKLRLVSGAECCGRSVACGMVLRAW